MSQTHFFLNIFDDWIDEATVRIFFFFLKQLGDKIALLKTSFSCRKSRGCFIYIFREFSLR